MCCAVLCCAVRCAELCAVRCAELCDVLHCAVPRSALLCSVLSFVLSSVLSFVPRLCFIAVRIFVALCCTWVSQRVVRPYGYVQLCLAVCNVYRHAARLNRI